MRTLLLFILLLFCTVLGIAKQGGYPSGVEAVLKKAGKNRAELEKAISYCKKTKNPLKLKAIYFLIANMDIHYSQYYYWVDSQGKNVAFDELSYPDFEVASASLKEIKRKNPGMHPVTRVTRDIDCIKADFLITNLESAFKAWKNLWAKNIPFADFCEYILPYRVSVEPLQDWREKYSNKFRWFANVSKTKGMNTALSYVSADYSNWFKVSLTERSEPLPRLGALQLLSRKTGPCEDMADLTAFTLRSQGVPVSVNIVPYWATSTGSHFLNSVFDGQMHLIPIDVSGHTMVNNKLGREPAKVIRVTYAKQPGTLASLFDKINIPEGFMRTTNYVDITNQYWETANVTCDINPRIKLQLIFACVFNGLHWKPVWWGNNQNHTVTFNSMCKGAVFLPACYILGHIVPAGQCVAVGYHNSHVLKPDTLRKRTVIITEEDKYLQFQPGKTYQLYYWDKTWKKCGLKFADYTHKLTFNDVPNDALMLLMPQYSTGKERPFTITNDGRREWW